MIDSQNLTWWLAMLYEIDNQLSQLSQASTGRIYCLGVQDGPSTQNDLGAWHNQVLLPSLLELDCCKRR